MLPLPSPGFNCQSFSLSGGLGPASPLPPDRPHIPLDPGNSPFPCRAQHQCWRGLCSTDFAFSRIFLNLYCLQFKCRCDIYSDISTFGDIYSSMFICTLDMNSYWCNYHAFPDFFQNALCLFFKNISLTFLKSVLGENMGASQYKHGVHQAHPNVRTSMLPRTFCLLQYVRWTDSFIFSATIAVSKRSQL